jgi:hypothetical protein
VPTLTTAIALYAALASTVAISWEIFVWWRANRTKLNVVLGGTMTAGPHGRVSATRVIVINPCRFEVTICRVFLVALDGAGRGWFAEPGEQGLPLTIPAQNQAGFLFPISDGDLFSDERVVARVWTAIGAGFSSPKVALGDLVGSP